MEFGNSAIKFLYLVLIFLVGFVIGFIWNAYSGSGFTGFVIGSNSLSTPSNFLDNKDILIYPDRVVLNVGGATLSSYDSTGSMIPALGSGVNGIVVKPESDAEISVGDIISFRNGNRIIVHRVIYKGIDDQGVYFITKGDNSEVSDGKIRFEDVEHVVVALVY